MKAIKIFGAVWFIALLIGVPAAYLASSEQSPPQLSRSGSGSETFQDVGRSLNSYPCPTHSGGYRCQPSTPGNQEFVFDGYPQGIERFLLVGKTDIDDPGNSTTSFLMAFFGLSAAIAGVALAVQRIKALLATVLISGGIALFIAGQVMWQGSENYSWLLALSFLAVNVAVLAGLSFTVFRTSETRRLLTMGVVASLIVATVMLQSGIFYELIGSPDYDSCRYCDTAIS